MAISREYYIELKARDEMSKTITKLSSLFSNLREQIDLNTSAYKRLVQTVNSSVVSLPKEMSRSMNTVNKEVSNSFKETNKSLDSSGTKIDKLSRKTRTMFSNLNVGTTDFSRKLTTMYGLIDTILISLGVSFYAPVKAASSYEDAMLELKRTLNMSVIKPSQLTELKKAFILSKGMGSFEDLTKIASVSAKQGIQKIDDLIETTQVFSKITNALDMSVEKIQKPLLAIVKLNEQERGNKEMFSGKNLMKYADILAHLENELPKVDVPGLTAIWQRSVKTFNKLKLTTEEQAAISAVMLQRGVNVSSAASEIRMFVNRFRHVYDQTGIDLRDIIVNHSKGSLEGLKQALKMIQDKFGGPQGHMKQHKIFGSLGIKFLGTMKTAFADLDYAMLKVSQSKGAVDREFQEFIKTFTASVGDFKKSFRALFAVIGTPMLRILEKVMKIVGSTLDRITMFLINYPQFAKIIGSISLAFSAFIATGVSVMFTLKLFNISLVSIKLILAGFPALFGLVKASVLGLQGAFGFATKAVMLFAARMRMLPAVLYAASTAGTVFTNVMRALQFAIPGVGKALLIITALYYAIDYLYKSGILTKIKDKLVEVFSGVLDFFKCLYDGFVEYISSAFSSFKSFLSTIYSYVGWIGSKIKSAASWVMSKVCGDNIIKNPKGEVALSILTNTQTLDLFFKEQSKYLNVKERKVFTQGMGVLKKSERFSNKPEHTLTPEAQTLLRAALLNLVEGSSRTSYIKPDTVFNRKNVQESLKKLGMKDISEVLKLSPENLVKKLQSLNEKKKKIVKPDLKTITEVKKLSDFKAPIITVPKVTVPNETKLNQMEKKLHKTSDTTKDLINELREIKRVILNQTKVDEEILREAKNNNESIESLSLYDRSKFGSKMRDFNLAEV